MTELLVCTASAVWSGFADAGGSRGAALRSRLADDDAVRVRRTHRRPFGVLLAWLVAVLPLGLGACGARAQEGSMNTLTAEERSEGWRLLFDGRTTEGWRGYMREGMPDGWQAIDGELTRVARAGDIITTDTFSDFELTLDWKVGPGGNSGVFYRAVEGPEQIYHSAPELQVLDDAGHADGGSPLTSAGSNYGLDPAPRGVVRPAGEWNSTRIVVDGNRVEHWLNGTKVVEYELGSAGWQEKVANSKFAEWPEYGKAREGHIGLQDHGDRVAFRNIKIRELR